MFCKQLLGVKTSTQNDFIYGELGRTNYYTRRIYIIVKYWFKVLNSDNRKYIKNVYNLMLNDMNVNPNTRNWASLVKNVLSHLGFYHAWLSQGVGDINKFLSILKQRLTDSFIQNWRQRLNEFSRASFYKEISVFCFQPYLNIVNIKTNRNALTRLRLSSHKLFIESGRWNRPQPTPREERKCTICNILEDEFHLLLECRMYDEFRYSLIKPYYVRRKSMQKAVELLSPLIRTSLKI